MYAVALFTRLRFHPGHLDVHSYYTLRIDLLSYSRLENVTVYESSGRRGPDQTATYCLPSSSPSAQDDGYLSPPQRQDGQSTMDRNR